MSAVSKHLIMETCCSVGANLRVLIHSHESYLPTYLLTYLLLN
jgi:hypothetical protein